MADSVHLSDLHLQFANVFTFTHPLSDPGAHHEALEDIPQRAAAQLHPAEHPAVPLRPGRLRPRTAGLGRFDSRVARKKYRHPGLTPLQSRPGLMITRPMSARPQWSSTRVGATRRI